jgi:hypothetical protein
MGSGWPIRSTVDSKNTKTPELWLQAIAGGEPIKIMRTAGRWRAAVCAGWEADSVSEQP